MGSNVFLVPCDPGNFDRTVDPAVDLSEYTDHPSALSDMGGARLWGAREGPNNQKFFEKMESGDLLLFYQDNRYIGTGRVGTTFRDEEEWVSTTFWDGAPSELIYTVDDFTPISVRKAAVNTIFDYVSDYHPEGLMRVAEKRLDNRLDAIELALKNYNEKHQ